MSRRQPRGAETRRRILDVALREFAARGYANVTVEEIAAAAGVTKGAVYYWFADKDDLGRDLQRDLWERLGGVGLGALDPHGDTVSNLRRGFDAYLVALSDADEARFFLRDAWTIPVLDEAGRRDHEAAVEMITRALADAIDQGQIVALDAAALARVLLGGFAEATLHVLRTGERAPAEAVVDHLLESLRAPPASAGVAHAREEPNIR